jgi:hypothetical protein
MSPLSPTSGSSNRKIEKPGGNELRQVTAVLGSSLLAVGLLFLYLGVGHQLRNVLAMRSWVETSCTIVDMSKWPWRDLTYQYEFAGQTYTNDRYQQSRFIGGHAWAPRSDAFPPGTRLACYVNPANPAQAIISRGFNTDFPEIVRMGLVLFLAGALSVGVAIPNPNRGDPKTTPSTIVDAPKRVAGSVELVPSTPRGSRLRSGIVYLLAWTAAFTLYFSQVPHEVWNLTDPAAILWTGMFVVGVWFALKTLGGVIRDVLLLGNPLPALRVTPGAIRLGDDVTVNWRFTGKQQLRRFQISLEGRETLFYSVSDGDVKRIPRSVTRAPGTVTRYGRNYSWVTHVFGTVRLLDLGAPVSPTGAFTVSLPRDMMHSFDGGYSRVTWWLRARSDAGGAFESDDEFQLDIAPAPADS